MSRQPRNWRPALAAGVASLALALAGCGQDDGTSTKADAGGGGEATSASTTTATETTKVAVAPTASAGFDPQQLYADAAPGVVTIISVLREAGSPLSQAQAGQGSGFVLNEEGEIVTNAHVVTDAAEAGGGAATGPIKEASEVYVEFGDRNQVPAKIIGFDPNADVALIEVDPEGLDLQPLPLGDSDTVEVGAPVAAMGSPFGQEQSLSTGIVSATDRSIESLTQFRIDGAIQTDASINPGNSGGPLIGADGRVIGIDQQINTTSGGNEGVGFAVPINLVKRSLDDLRDDGTAEYAYIGVQTQTLYPQLAEELNLDTETGALVTKVTPDSPAQEAGLRAGDERKTFQATRVTAGGDVITEVEGEPIVTDGDLAQATLARQPGDTIELTILRDGEEMKVDVTLGDRSEASGG